MATRSAWRVTPTPAIPRRSASPGAWAWTCRAAGRSPKEAGPMTMLAAAGPSLAQADGYRLSVDTGGTFTDGFVTSGDRFAQVKVDTTPADPTEGFAACVAAAAEAMDESLPAFLAQARMVHFSSTIATNTVVQRSGAHVGLIVTAGCERSLYGSPDDAVRLCGFVGPAAVRGVAE